MARNYAALPHEYLEEMEALNDAEFGRLTRALLKYSMTGDPIALCGNERFYANRVMSQEARFQESYKESFEKRSEAGKKGASKRWQTDGKNGNAILLMTDDGKNGNTETKTNTKTNTIPSNDGNSNGRFRPPTLEEVSSYCLEQGYQIDPQQFVDFYVSKGWRVGQATMKDWKAAVRNWDRRSGEFSISAKNTKSTAEEMNRDAWKYVRGDL